MGDATLTITDELPYKIDERLIERIIGENLYTELRARKIKYENIIRAKAFLEKYKYGFFEKAKNYLSFI